MSGALLRGSPSVPRARRQGVQRSQRRRSDADRRKLHLPEELVIRRCASLRRGGDRSLRPLYRYRLAAAGKIVRQMFGEQSHQERGRDCRRNGSPARRAKTARRCFVRVSRREGDDTCGTTILIDALQNADALPRKAIGRKCGVGLLGRGHLDIIEGSGKIRASLFARRARLQVRAVG